MDGWITGLIVAAIQAIVTTIIGLVINNKWNKQKKEKTEFEELKESSFILNSLFPRKSLYVNSILSPIP